MPVVCVCGGGGLLDYNELRCCGGGVRMGKEWEGSSQPLSFEVSGSPCMRQASCMPGASTHAFTSSSISTRLRIPLHPPSTPRHWVACVVPACLLSQLQSHTLTSKYSNGWQSYGCVHRLALPSTRSSTSYNTRTVARTALQPPIGSTCCFNAVRLIHNFEIYI